MVSYLSIGSNLGFGGWDARATALAAVDALANEPEIDVLRTSSVYRTEPVGGVSQPEFANLVIAIRTGLAPERLLAVCHDVERRFGRQRIQAGGPRSLDLDVLLMGATIRRASPVLPHPRLHLRRFVLAPLFEIAPDVRLPTGEAIGDLLAALGDGQRVELWRADGASPRRRTA